MLTDSYRAIDNGFLSLSGKSVGADGVAADVVSSLTGGDIAVEFKPIDLYAKKLAEDRFGKKFEENPEGFIIEITDTATVYADTDAAKLFASCAIKDEYENGRIERGVRWSYPCVPHRSLRVFLPPKKDLKYFYKLIDMLVHLGYNAVLLEIAGAMEFKRHPEINRGWLDYCASVNESAEKYNLVGKGYYRTKASVHTHNAGGGVYSQEEIRELVKYCRERFIEIVPEVPSLTHCEYICASHPELAECDDEPYAATCCPSNPELNKLVFDLYDEVIDVFGCKALHIGHDEWWTMCVCDKCKDKDPSDLYVNNVLECYNYLKSKGVKTYMWGEKLQKVTDKNGEQHGAAGKDVYAVPTASEHKTVNVMGKDYPVYDRYWFKAPEWVKNEGFHQVIREVNCEGRLPDDIVYVNWGYSTDPYIASNVFYREGKEMILGNTLPSCLNNYKQRFEYGARGISISSWAETSEDNMQVWGTMFELGYGSVICWKHERDEFDYEKNVLDTFSGLYKLNNRTALNGSHIEVEHTVVKEWADGRKYYDGMNPVDKEFLTLGNYVVTYENGETEELPAVYSVNISSADVKLSRIASRRNWDYEIDPDLPHTAASCDIFSRDGKVWYKAVMPVSQKVVKCEYVPKKGFEDYVEVGKINVKQA